MEHMIDWATAKVGRPVALVFVVIAANTWIVGNLIAGERALDQLPYPDLEFAISAAALATRIGHTKSGRAAPGKSD